MRIDATLELHELADRLAPEAILARNGLEIGMDPLEPDLVVRQDQARGAIGPLPDPISQAA